VSYFLSGRYQSEINANSSLKGTIASSFGQLIADIANSSNGAVISPIQFQKTVTYIKPNYSRYTIGFIFRLASMRLIYLTINSKIAKNSFDSF